MTETRTDEYVLKVTGEIVVAYLNAGKSPPDDLVSLVRGIREALLGSPAETSAPVKVQAPAVERASLVELDKTNAAAGDVARLADQSSGAQPAVPAADSITDDYLISLEDGKRYRSLKRHLQARYGMSPDDYRQKWNLPADYPMVAPAYARSRSEIAARIGLGGPRRGPSAKASTKHATA